ncbi:MAG: NUDIX hydrolase [Chloroflexi bacterium]|nr:NUDIX hydrolase [Chloroflexota bacterium]
MENETVLGSELVHTGRTIRLRIDSVRLSNGLEITRDVVEHPGAVAVVPLTENGDVLLVRQYRHAVGRVLLEIPAGTRRRGEDPLLCAGREIREETGHRAGRIERLTGFYTAPGFCEEYLEVYLARDLAPDPLAMDEDEEIEVERVPFATALQLIGSGEICDAKSIIGLLVARQVLEA